MAEAAKFSTGRAIAALSVAVAADVIQLPLMLAFVASAGSVVGIAAAIPVEAVDVAVDVIAACVTTWLLGFHWALLPTTFLEAVPGLAAAPTWTGCVLFVLWRRRRDAASAGDGAALRRTP
jgi:hypothetical protein